MDGGKNVVWSVTVIVKATCGCGTIITAKTPEEVIKVLLPQATAHAKQFGHTMDIKGNILARETELKEIEGDNRPAGEKWFSD